MDPFSIAASNEIFAAFPEWRATAREEKAEDGSTFLVIEIAPTPEAQVEHGLVIDTANQEVTVGFDCYHSHFDESAGDGVNFGIEAALEFVRQIICERIAVVSWWDGEDWRGSAQLAPGAQPETPPWVRGFDRIRVRSWKGSLNADIRPIQA
jgi:hypothetical protein